MTTIFGWDLSHYDAPDSRRAVDEGISFFTHKIGGDGNDGEAASWWSYMKSYRDRVMLGGYWVLYPGSPAARADAFLSRLDSQCPGWRDAPFILQADCEKWGGNPGTVPSRSEIEAFCDRLRAKMPKLMPVVYGPKWVYGNGLAGLSYPLWASSYVGGSGSVSKLYPGDGASGWNRYSGQTPLILQFTSSATIAGQTTCDGNAFRGTLDQLQAKLAPGWATDGGNDMAVTQDMIDAAELGFRKVLASGFRAATGQAPDGDAGKPDRNARDQFRAIVGGPVDQNLLLAAITAEGVDNNALAAAIIPGLTAALVAALPTGTLTEADVEQALRDFFGQLVAQHAQSMAALGEPVGEADIFTQTQRELAQRRIQGGDQG